MAQANARLRQERNRLAALMSELNQSVVVCNLDGRILLYNGQARRAFRAISEAPAVGDGADLIGIGRSIHAVFDRAIVTHALASIRRRLDAGDPMPSAQFVTATRTGHLLRAQMAPVRDAEDEGTPGTAAGTGMRISGFVLMLENVTGRLEAEMQRDRLLHELTEGSRASLANLQAAADVLDDAGLPADHRQRFLTVVRDEVAAMSRRITELAERSAKGIRTRWPLEDILGNDLLDAARHRIAAQAGTRVDVTAGPPDLWLMIDSFSLLQALASLSSRLVDAFGVKVLSLRLCEADGHARLDLVWSGHAMSTETVMTWESEPMRIGDESTPLSVRDVVERHDGAMWFERDRARQQAFFRFLLPISATAAPPDLPAPGESRPEYYDFDLFGATEPDSPLDDRSLNELTFTVFDTETTGLDPGAGDEIIQIGAVRIVNGRLLRGECFDQLVDPARTIPAASIPIHGITPAMVEGQPRIGDVLPAFQRFARDSVLVAHNAAFDMKFLQLKEASTGIRFHQPVLDTLLLSAIAHPNQESHRLEAIAARFNVPVVGRHTALGDALVTAEVLLRLIPLLQSQGIGTLREAREASQKSYLARISY